jgi:hypothetical protein
MAGAGAGPQVFTHVSTEIPIKFVANRVGAGGKATLVGKPAGFWMAPGLSWVALVNSRQSWEIAAEIVPLVRPADRFSHTLEFYEDVFEEKRVPDYVPGTPLKKIFASTIFDKTHYVYQVEIPASTIVETFDAPDPKQVFRLTAPALEAFLAKVDPWYKTIAGTTAQYPKEKPFGGRLADYYREFMAPKWGGIFFDASLFTEELKTKHRWIHDLEIPSLCLWKPLDVLNLPASETNFEPFLKAVLTLVGDKQALAEKIHKGHGPSVTPIPLKPYINKLYVAAWTADDTLVMIMRKGKFVESSKPGGKLALPGGRRLRGRTFRRTFRRRDKNGGRLTRKSKPRRHK